MFSPLYMQMLIYLFSLCQKEGPFAGSLPAGVLYMPAAVTYSDVEGEPDEGSAALFSKGLTQSGLVLRDLEVVRAMEPGVAGDFIPVKQNKDGKMCIRDRDGHGDADDHPLRRDHPAPDAVGHLPHRGRPDPALRRAKHRPPGRPRLF